MSDSKTTTQKSPRSSPLSFLFHSKSESSADNESPSFMRSLSKCFDGGLEDTLIEEDGNDSNIKQSTVKTSLGALAAKSANANAEEPPRDIVQWGPTHSTSSENLRKSKGLYFQPGFKKSVLPQVGPPSPGSSARNSARSTTPTAPITTSTQTGTQQQHKSLQQKTGMSSVSTNTPTSPRGNCSRDKVSSTAATARNSNTSFWDFARPANLDTSSSGAKSFDSHHTPLNSFASVSANGVSPLSITAKKAADAMMSMLNNVEGFVKGDGIAEGFCSPRSSPRSGNQMEGIPEESDLAGGAAADTKPAASNSNCFKICGADGDADCFEEFHANAFSGEANATAGMQAATKVGCTKERQQQPQQPKGYEIRLKSSFSQAEAKRATAAVETQKKVGGHSPSQQQRMSTNEAGQLGNLNVTIETNKSSAIDSDELRSPHQQQTPNVSRPAMPQQELNQQNIGSRALPDGLPIQSIAVPVQLVERSVSELTMRSHGYNFDKNKCSSDSRRMAYYAVGRAHGAQKRGRGGNQRCYFTGVAIPYGTPFYAGSVQQGPRTLVVFCLPSALGLSTLVAHSVSKEERERYLQALPECDDQLLSEMKNRYQDDFDTLPMQVRSPDCWKLFIKFCYFSGLPIAEGEMHYRVKSSVSAYPDGNRAKEGVVEEIALSHEVMEAVNGEVSAEILRLPNSKTFEYLQRQYTQQSSKLNEVVFNRTSWEMMMPEI